ncbi:hypothetical protein LZ32DRAFT_611199 [Colletotrichum eremochloae]|nr:hypothetical protein LZ32DRAFT_611199 [Colletotrichum eremochloae]
MEERKCALAWFTTRSSGTTSNLKTLVGGRIQGHGRWHVETSCDVRDDTCCQPHCRTGSETEKERIWSLDIPLRI